MNKPSLLEFYAGQADIPWSVVLDGMRQNAIKIPAGQSDYSWSQVVEYRAGIKFREAEAMIKEAEKRQ